jgi:hypothetical protein
MIRELLLAGGALTAVYAITISFLYLDLTAPIKSYLGAFGRIMVMVSIAIASHYIILDTQITDLIFPIKSSLAKFVIPTSVIPLTETSFRLCFVTACLIAIIDKLIYLWCRRRLPYLITLAITFYLSFIGYITLDAIASQPVNTIAHRTIVLNEAFQAFIPIMIGLIGILFVVIIITTMSKLKKIYMQ